jgi:hypothetical protein
MWAFLPIPSSDPLLSAVSNEALGLQSLIRSPMSSLRSMNRCRSGDGARSRDRIDPKTLKRGTLTFFRVRPRLLRLRSYGQPV